MSEELLWGDWEYIRKTFPRPYSEEEQDEAFQRLSQKKRDYARALFSQDTGLSQLEKDLQRIKKYYEQKGCAPGIDFFTYRQDSAKFEENIGQLEEAIEESAEAISAVPLSGQYLDFVEKVAPVPDEKKAYWDELHQIAARNIFLTWSVRQYPSLEDIQEGYLGLVDSLDKFEVGRGKFSTYALHWVKQRLNGASYNQMRYAMRIPRYVLNLFSGLRRLERDDVDYNDMIEYCLSEGVVDKAARRVVSHFKSLKLCLSQAVGRIDGKQAKLSDMLVEKTIVDVQITDQEKEIERTLRAELNNLTLREQDILRMRFEDDMTLDLVGDRLGLTGARIGQIEREVLDKLRNNPQLIQLYEQQRFDMTMVPPKYRITER
jgi:RNA polymerase sigma factor (sigma-70 family)